ncbi:hypothetical protein RFI_24052, partial [Reticulomyxa filosa]
MIWKTFCLFLVAFFHFSFWVMHERSTRTAKAASTFLKDIFPLFCYTQKMHALLRIANHSFFFVGIILLAFFHKRVFNKNLHKHKYFNCKIGNELFQTKLGFVKQKQISYIIINIQIKKKGIFIGKNNDNKKQSLIQDKINRVFQRGYSIDKEKITSRQIQTH